MSVVCYNSKLVCHRYSTYRPISVHICSDSCIFLWKAMSFDQVPVCLYKSSSLSVASFCVITVITLHCLLSIMNLPWGGHSARAARASTGCLIYYKSAVNITALQQQSKQKSVWFRKKKNNFKVTLTILDLFNELISWLIFLTTKTMCLNHVFQPGNKHSVPIGLA